MTARKPPEQTLGQRIKAARLAARLTQQEAADRAGLARSQWADLEAGRFKSPTILTLRKAAKAVGCTPADLLR